MVVHLVVGLSNHYHLLLAPTDAKQLDDLRPVRIRERKTWESGSLGWHQLSTEIFGPLGVIDIGRLKLGRTANACS